MTIYIGLNLVKNRFVSLSLSDHNSRKSREPLKRFSQNLVLHIFRAREDVHLFYSFGTLKRFNYIDSNLELAIPNCEKNT